MAQKKSSITKSTHQKALTSLLVFCFTLAAFSYHFDWFRSAEFSLHDFFAQYHAQSQAFDSEIIFVDIDDHSMVEMQNIAGKWPWPRSVFAEIIEGVNEVKPKALIFDILFSERDRYRPDSDAYFNEVLAQTNNVFLSSLVLESDPNQGQIPLTNLDKHLAITPSEKANENGKINLLLPEAVMPDYWRLGLINFPIDSDGKTRRYYVNYPYQGWRIASLPTRALIEFDYKITNASFIDLSWRNSDSLHKVRLYELYQWIVNEDSHALEQFNNKFILFGSTASGLHDLKQTPLSDIYPGSYVVATALDNLLNDDFLKPISPAISWLSLFACLGLLLSVFFAQWSFRRQITLSSVLLILLSASLITAEFVANGRNILFTSGNIITNLVMSYLLFNITLGVLEHLQRKKAENLFGRFLDPNIVKELVASGELDIENMSKDVNITILFSDIRGFTTLSEKHSAKEVVELLNRYFDLQVSTIFNTRGTLDKFIGDCIMAFWGAPVANANHADDAIEAALQMEQHLLDFQQSLPEELRTFDVGIGIHTGPAVVGMIGASQRVDYTAIGDAVNLASRIEGLTKDKARILVSEETKHASKGDFSFKYCGEFQVKGREQPVKLYQPTRAANVSGRTLE